MIQEKAEKKPLKDSDIKKLEAGPSTYTVWDGGDAKAERGLGVRVTPNGVKTFVWKYVYLGKQRWMAIGRTSSWTVSAARSWVAELRQKMDKGQDPAEINAPPTPQPPMSELCSKFLTEHVATKRKARTLEDYTSIVDTYILPTIGKVPIRALEASHVAALHQGLANKPYRANRVLAVLSSMLSLAETWGLRDVNTNPCGTIERFEEQRRTNFLTPAQLSKLLSTLNQVENRYPTTVNIARLLLLTGARLREITDCRWQREKGDPSHPYLDFSDPERPRIVAPDHKGSRRQGPKDIHLSSFALAVIQGIKRIRKCPYLFPNQDDLDRPIASPHCNWIATVDRRGKAPKTTPGIRDLAGLPELRFHDLRHSFGALSVTLGQDPTIRQKLLGHASAKTTLDIYSHAQLDPMREAVEAIGRALLG